MAKKKRKVGYLGTIVFDEIQGCLSFVEMKHLTGASLCKDGKHLYVSICPNAHSDEAILFGRFVKVMRHGLTQHIKSDEVKSLWDKFCNFLKVQEEWMQNDKCGSYIDVGAPCCPVVK